MQGHDRNRPGEPTTWHIPPRLAVLTVICLFAAVMFGLGELKNSRDTEALRVNGRTAVAVITGVHATVGNDHKKSYTIDLTWRDGSGAERRFGPTHISGAYAQRIAPDGVFVTVRQTAIRYVEEDYSARPVIVDDADEQTKQDQIGRVSAVVFGIVGIALAALTIRLSRRV